MIFSNLKMNPGSAIALVLCVTMLALSTTGCTPAQQQDAKAIVAKVAAYEPSLVTAVDTLASTVALFVPTDAALITASQAIFDASAAQLQTLCAAYAATPTASTLATIESVLTTLLNTNAAQFLAAAHISNPASVATAKLAIGGVRTILLLMDAALQGTQTAAQTAASQQARLMKLHDFVPYLDKHQVEQATGVPFRVAVGFEEARGF